MVSLEQAFDGACYDISRLTLERDAWKERYDLAAELAVKFSCERDTAVAQRDRAVEVLRDCEWALPDASERPTRCPVCSGHRDWGGHEIGCRFASSIANAPVPDRLADEREAGRRDGLKEAAEIIEAGIESYSPNGKCLAPRDEGNTMGLTYAAAVRARALRDTPADGVGHG